MFCSSLRQKKEWAPVINELSKNNWKETKLEAHDVAFHVGGNDGNAVFRGVIASSAEVGTSDLRDRLERLHLPGGGAFVFVILFLKGDGSVDALINLQIESATSGLKHFHEWLTVFRMLNATGISVIPILSAMDLPACLSDLRKQCSEQLRVERHGGAPKRELLSHCVRGLPLSERQTFCLMGISSDLKDLMRRAFTPEMKGLIYDLLGEKDAYRLVSYFTEGPAPVLD